MNEEQQITVDSILTPVEVKDLNRTTETILYTEKGNIHVIHEITLGDVIISTILMAMLIFMVIERFVRR